VRLNPRKTILQPVSRGVDFVGHVIKPWCRTTRRGTVAKAVARMRDLPAADVHQVANSYFGLLSQATHSHQDRARFANAVRHRGHCITGALTKAFP
jgi:RNA-directed DNA polymerase